ncbi:WD40-repeat-containing domain protein [Rhodocollybia butyracea]|uniref:WD40-repeat-containing domain protein n=1 Tax=Rhodocollybia butyracea TaxID=206335 RepID=A0A9P5PXC9_9AGAR|nr:WD40-repeat-containing domain protein [Rhodocollybia butyracea]
MDDLSTAWKPPQYNISCSPSLDEVFSLTQDPNFPENFARITKWSPDGSVHLSQCENRSFQLGAFNTDESEIEPRIREFRQPAPIVDYAWYPTASPRDPASFCFVASVRECPVKLLDASDGRLRASYPIIDHRERFIAPQSLAFNLSAQKLYCGFEDAIEVFDVAAPGEGIRLPTTPNKSSKDGLKGIISAMAFSPSYDSDVFAAGSLNASRANIALFSESQGQVPLMFLDGGLKAGVMQLQFNPMQPHLLYASFRRDMRIFCWDLRYNVDQPSKIFGPMVSTAQAVFKEPTNQKHRFDIDISGSYLSVGRQDGTILIYDLNEGHSSELLDADHDTPLTIAPGLSFPAHQDSVGSVAFHPTSARLLSSSGSRNFDFTDSDSDSDLEEGNDSGDAETCADTRVVLLRSKRQPKVQDASLKLWKF